MLVGANDYSPILIVPPLPRIPQILLRRLPQNLQISLRLPLGHAEILLAVIAAFVGLGARDFPLERKDPLKRFRDDRKRVAAVHILLKDRVKSGSAPHRTEVDGLSGIGRMVAQKGRDFFHFSPYLPLIAVTVSRLT